MKTLLLGAMLAMGPVALAQPQPGSPPPAAAAPAEPPAAATPSEGPKAAPTAEVPPPAAAAPSSEAAPSLALPEAAKPLPPAPEAAAVPAGARPTETVAYRRRYGLMAAGIVLFAVGYFGNIGVTYGFRHDPSTTSLIPLAGPFIQMFERWKLPDDPPVNSGDPAFDSNTRSNINQANNIIEPVAYSWTALAGALQLTGVTMTIVGAATRSRVKEAAPRASWRLAPLPGGAQVLLTF